MVLEDEFRELSGRAGKAVLTESPAAATPAAPCSSSFFEVGMAVSLRIERAEGARPVPRLPRLMGSTAI